MFDYLSIQNSTENPTFITILFTVLLAFLLSTLIAFTHEKTSRNVSSPTNYLQAIVFASVIAATVMQAIGDSLARGLGMLGALAIIRFRTTLRDPRNMMFMFASLAAGIACGVYGFVIGIIGTLAFVTVAFILRFSPFSKMNNLIGVLKFDLPQGAENFERIKEVLNNNCKNNVMIRYRIQTDKSKQNLVSYEYRLKLKREEEGQILAAELMEFTNAQTIKLSFEDTPDSV